ncbi:unnamed protein product, partial [Medioppia subpectinata]
MKFLRLKTEDSVAVRTNSLVTIRRQISFAAKDIAQPFISSMSSTIPQMNHTINNGCNNSVINELLLSTQSRDSHTQSGHHTSDSDQSTIAQSQDNDRKHGLYLPIITGPNGSQLNDPNSDRQPQEYSESEKSIQSSKKASKSHHKSGNEWEILEGLKDGQRCEDKPNKFDGFMLKRRKWPLKGWHKRHFHLENGILSYSKSPNDMMKGKIHGSVDVGLSVISTKRSSKRIDIDAEEFIYHIKVKNRIMFTKWISMLRHHRLYRQHEISFGNRINAISTPVRSVAVTGIGSGGGITPTNHEMNSKVIAWILDSNPLEMDTNFSKELIDLQLKLVKLSSLLKLIEMQIESKSDAIPSAETVSLKKSRRRFLLRRKKQNNSTSSASTDKPVTNSKKSEPNDTTLNDKNATKLKPLPIGHHLSSSHPVLNEASLAPNSSPDNWMTQSCNEAETDFKDHSQDFESIKSTKAIIDFVSLANDVNNSFRTLYRMVQSDGTKKKSMKRPPNDFDLVYTLRQSLSEALQQNKML